MKSGYLSSVKIKLDEFSKFLADKPWFAGNEVIIA